MPISPMRRDNEYGSHTCHHCSSSGSRVHGRGHFPRRDPRFDRGSGPGAERSQQAARSTNTHVVQPNRSWDPPLAAMARVTTLVAAQKRRGNSHGQATISDPVRWRGTIGASGFMDEGTSSPAGCCQHSALAAAGPSSCAAVRVRAVHARPTNALTCSPPRRKRPSL